jgi:hypothetical protein
MRQDGKRPPALIMFTKITLDPDLLLAGKARWQVILPADSQEGVPGIYLWW